MSQELVRSDGESPAYGILLSLDYDYYEEDLFLGACAIDLKNKLDTRRNFQAVALFVIIWVFIPQLIENPVQILNWLIIFAALALIWMLWRYPEIQNRKFAQRKAQESAKVHLDFTEKQIEIQEGSSYYTAEYTAQTQVCESQEVFALSHNKGHVLVIPKKQLSEQQIDQLRHILHNAYDAPVLFVKEKPGWFSSRKKDDNR